MKLLSIVNILLVSAGSLTLAAPTPTSYNELAPSARALIDAGKLIVSHPPFLCGSTGIFSHCQIVFLLLTIP
jgi:hypothetical protein